MRQPDERWTAALDAVGAVRGDRVAAFADLRAAYGATPRHYHHFEHASQVVDAVLSVHCPGDDWAPVVLAAWYHDAVYDAQQPSGHNEGASAVLATQALRDLGASRAVVGEVARLICLTADHLTDSADRNGALLCDADLSPLAAGGDEYDTNVAAVRKEFAHVSDDAWRTGRRAVLRSFLDRPRIYQTLSGREQWEARARINISSELASLG